LGAGGAVDFAKAAPYNEKQNSGPGAPSAPADVNFLKGQVSNMGDTDKRWEQLAASIVNYSFKMKPGEKMMIAMHEIETYPLALAVYGEVVKAGGYAQIQFVSEAMKHKVLKYGTDQQISWVPEVEAFGMDWADYYLGLRGAFNLDECYDIPSEKVAMYQKAMGVISADRWKKTKWALVRVPNEHFAQQAHVSYEKIMEMFFNACTLDWEAYVKQWQRVCDIFDKGSHLHLTGHKTDFEFDYGGNKWTVMDNTTNIPDGEFYVTPKWNTVKGHIFFEFPATLGGRVINDLSLEFKDGEVCKADASTNLDYVNMILDCTPNARRVGEFAFGTNPYVDICTTDILIDEKIMGSMHMALGRPYDAAYQCPIHWDIVKDTRKDAEVTIDGKLVFKDGKFLV